MRVHVRLKQLLAFFKFQGGWTMKNMKSAQAILSNVVANLRHYIRATLKTRQKCIFPNSKNIEMKKLNLLILIITISCASYSQNKINMGGGITYKTGGVLELELEKQFTESFSLPLRGDVGYFLTNDYNALTFDWRATTWPLRTSAVFHRAKGDNATAMHSPPLSPDYSRAARR